MFGMFRNALLGESSEAAEPPAPGTGASTARASSAAVVELSTSHSQDRPNTEPPARGRADALQPDDYFMGLALLTAQRSPDPCTQVGAVVVSGSGAVLATGFNDMPAACRPDAFSWAKQPHSAAAALCPLRTKYPFVCHAELNAVLGAVRAGLGSGAVHEQGARLFVTLFPCNECAKLIVQAQIKHVVFLKDKPDKLEMRAARLLFQEAGVTFEPFSTERSALALNLKAPEIKS